MSSTHLTRGERLALTRVALSGIASGIVRAVAAWVLAHIFPW